MLQEVLQRGLESGFHIIPPAFLALPLPHLCHPGFGKPSHHSEEFLCQIYIFRPKPEKIPAYGPGLAQGIHNTHRGPEWLRETTYCSGRRSSVRAATAVPHTGTKPPPAASRAFRAKWKGLRRTSGLLFPDAGDRDAFSFSLVA